MTDIIGFKRLKLLTTVLIFCAYSCSTEDANDCLQTEGQKITEKLDLDTFNKIRIEEGVNLIIQQGTVQKVILETGKNLRNDVDVRVEDNTLIARDNNNCNLFRDYGVTKITVTSPDIVEILNGSSFDVRSVGILAYPELSLRSLAIVGLALRKNGSFYLRVNTQNLSVVANGSSLFSLQGTTENLNVSFSDEIPRLEAENLLAQDVTLRHVSSNHMYVNAQQSLNAVLSGSGNVYAKTKPPVVAIEERYTGRVIFGN